MNKFLALAKRETTLSPIMDGREKMSVTDIMAKYPDGITLTEFDMVTMYDNKKGYDVVFPVFAFKEDNEKCFFGGTVLSRIAGEWIKAYNGDVTTASDDLLKAGGVKVKMTTKRTKEGNNITSVEVIE